MASGKAFETKVEKTFPTEKIEETTMTKFLLLSFYHKYQQPVL